MQTETVFDTKPLLRPDQVQSGKDEIKNLEAKLQNKHIEDKGEVSRQLRRARQDFEKQLPTPPADGAEEGRMASRAKQLLSEITVGMPSMEEMRKSPPGAVDKHRAWETRNKKRILEWKHIMLRMTAGTGDRDAANLEKHRPRASSLNMDGALIQGTQYFMPETAGPAVVFTDEQLRLLETLSPDLREKLSTLTNPQRAQVKDIVGGIGLTVDPIASAHGKLGAEKALAGKPGRKPWTQEQKDALKARLAAGKAKKAAAKKE